MKKMTKRVLAVLLALAMVIPGVYFGASEAEEVKAATDVSTDMLNVKVQVAVDDEDVIRFITSVDSLDYSKVGFEVESPSGTKTWETSTVYERIVSNVTNEEYEFSPKVVDYTSEYFVTAKLRATEGVDYTVRAFACTKGSAEKVYGPSRMVALSDANDNVINMMVDFATTADATYDVYDGSTMIGTAKVIGEKNVRITLDSKKVDEFPSATKLTFKSGSTSVGTAIYRNYYTKYTGEGTEDTTWYTVDKNATEYIVASNADLYGLATLVNSNTYVFSDKTVLQIRNIEVNKGTASTDSWTPSEGEITYEWISIGNPSYGFTGTYDGDENVISGLYETAKTSSSDTQRMGLFGTVSLKGKLQNIKVENSFYSFPSGMTNIGGIVGYCQGSLENIYVSDNVYMNSASGKAGGICGMYSVGSTSNENTFKNLWFDGTITSAQKYIGGIIGHSYRGKVTMENCLFTGTVSGTEFVGGIIGGAEGKSADSGTTAYYNRTTVINSVSAGTVQSSSANRVGSVVGGLSWTDIAFENVYTNENRVYTGSGSGFNANGDATGIGLLWLSPNKINVYGVPMAFTDELNGSSAYSNTGFDFWTKDNQDGAWVAMEDGHPVLALGTDYENAIDTLSGERVSYAWYEHNTYIRKAVLVDAQTEETTDDDVYEWQMIPNTATAKTYNIRSTADMYAFAMLCNNITNGEVFENDTITVMNDIDFNPGWVPQVDESGVLQNVPANIWKPIGFTHASIEEEQATNPTISREGVTSFKGTFDGNGNTFSGIYVSNQFRDTGLFGHTASTSKIKNIHITNSYYLDARSKGYVGAVVGMFKGTLLENIFVDETVMLKAGSTVGGVVGMLSQANTKTISKCWFKGSMWSSGSNVAGVVGRCYKGTHNLIENCLFAGKLTSAKGNVTGGIVGDGVGSSTKVTVRNCIDVGTMIVNSTTNVGADIGKVDASKTIIENVYSTNQITNSTTPSTTYATKTGVTLVDIADVKADAKTALAGVYGESNGMYNQIWSVDAEGMPVIRWNEDGVLKILLVGNSFCYYHTDELYGMLEADGTEAIVANVYDSGCSVAEHVTFLNNNTKRYQYIQIEDGVKTSVNYRTMTQCLETEDWDVISFQQHFDPSEAMDYATGSNITLSYAKTLYDYLKANHPEARLLWQQTWAYQVGYKGYADNDFSTSAPDKCVLDTAKQTLNYEIIRDVSKAVCEENDVELVPNGDAWQNARAVVGDILCDKSGTDLAADTSLSDNYHDGDVGGGQFVNACGWYEVITGLDCRNNTFVPSAYEFLVNTEFNAELTTQENVISALKEAVHTAVADVNQ